MYEDYDILVADKTSGLLTVGTERVRENTAYHHLTSYVKRGNQKSKNRIFIVHRLDKDTSGLIVFAKTEHAREYLQKEWHGFEKKYYAVVHGVLPAKEGIISSYLAENSAHRMYSVAEASGGVPAKTGFKVLKESKKCSLLEITLFTGKKNQIRVHFSERGFPVAGDLKYGKKDRSIKRLALHSASMTLVHPETKEKMTFQTEVPDYFASLVKG